MTKSVSGFVQVHLHAPLAPVETGEMTHSQAKMFTGRCVLKELSLAGHGSGKYPAVRCICNSLFFPIPPTKSWPFKEMMDELAALLFLPLSHLFSFLFFFFFFFPFHWRLKLCLCKAPRQILPLLCSLFQITLKSDAGLGQSPLALGFCAAVRVRSYDLWFADDMSNASLVAVEVVSNVRYDVTGLHITAADKWIQFLQKHCFLLGIVSTLCLWCCLYIQIKSRVHWSVCLYFCVLHAWFLQSNIYSNMLIFPPDVQCLQ